MIYVLSGKEKNLFWKLKPWEQLIFQALKIDWRDPLNEARI